jgi:hypothetical protein
LSNTKTKQKLEEQEKRKIISDREKDRVVQ